MFSKKKVIGGGIAFAVAAGAVLIGVSAANAAEPDVTEKPSHSATVEAADNGAVVSSVDDLPTADVEFDAEVQAKIDELMAQHPNGAAIQIDQDGNVTAQELPDGAGPFLVETEAAESE